MKMLLLRAFVVARRRHHLAETTRRQYRQRVERQFDAVMALAPTTERVNDNETAGFVD